MTLLLKARVPKVQFGELKIRCDRMGLDPTEALGLGVSRYLCMTRDADIVFPVCDRQWRIEHDRRSALEMDVRLVEMDMFVRIRSRYQSQSIGEMALISVCLDKLLDLSDNQIHRLVNVKRQTGILLKDYL